MGVSVPRLGDAGAAAPEIAPNGDFLVSWDVADFQGSVTGSSVSGTWIGKGPISGTGGSFSGSLQTKAMTFLGSLWSGSSMPTTVYLEPTSEAASGSHRRSFKWQDEPAAGESPVKCICKRYTPTIRCCTHFFLSIRHFGQFLQTSLASL